MKNYLKTSELTDATLDWAVAKCKRTDLFPEGTQYDIPQFSTDWSQGGPIIEREKISICENAGRWVAGNSIKGQEQYGPTPLIAAMRCYVASKLGDELEIPEALN